LCFSQEQAAAVHAATRGAVTGQVYISPFIGRLDDEGQNGMDLVRNILRMYKAENSHVQVLAASIRNFEHFAQALHVGAEIITAPKNVLLEWIEDHDMSLPDIGIYETPQGLNKIEYFELDLEAAWQSFDIAHHKTNEGLRAFAQDWNDLIKS